MALLSNFQIFWQKDKNIKEKLEKYKKNPNLMRPTFNFGKLQLLTPQDSTHLKYDARKVQIYATLERVSKTHLNSIKLHVCISGCRV